MAGMAESTGVRAITVAVIAAVSTVVVSMAAVIAVVSTAAASMVAAVVASTAAGSGVKLDACKRKRGGYRPRVVSITLPT
jgi:lysylphosphatidylglycerol synthetase-like protein (DUF2156 family)